MYWDTRYETLDRGALTQLQTELLQRTVARAGDAPYYRSVFTLTSARA